MLQDLYLCYTNVIIFAIPLSIRIKILNNAEVVKLVDTHVSEACGASYAGSSPAFGTFFSNPPDCILPEMSIP